MEYIIGNDYLLSIEDFPAFAKEIRGVLIEVGIRGCVFRLHSEDLRQGRDRHIIGVTFESSNDSMKRSITKYYQSQSLAIDSNSLFFYRDFSAITQELDGFTGILYILSKEIRNEIIGS